MTDRSVPGSTFRPPSHLHASGGHGSYSVSDTHEDPSPLESQRRGGFVDEADDLRRDDRFARPVDAFDPESNRLTQYLVACFDTAHASLTQVLQDTPYIYGAGALAFTVALIPFAGVAPASAAALVVIASTVASVMIKVLPEFMRDHSIRSSAPRMLAAVVLNTAAVTLAVAAVLGVTIPAAKGIIACATITAGVKYAQLAYFQNSGRSRREYHGERQD